MFWKWFKKRKRQAPKGPATPAQIGAQGQPLRVIQGPLSEGRSARNVARIKTCKRMLAELAATGKSEGKEYGEFAEELGRRQVRYDNDSVIKKLRKEGGL